MRSRPLVGKALRAILFLALVSVFVALLARSKQVSVKRGRLVVCLTTSPQRLQDEAFSSALDSLLTQELLPDAIVVVLPLLYRGEQHYDMSSKVVQEFVARGVRFERISEDFGPISKFFAPLAEEDVFVTVDDDAFYPSMLVEVLSNKLEQVLVLSQPKLLIAPEKVSRSALGFSGLYFRSFRSVEVVGTLGGIVDSLSSTTLLEGFGGAIFRKSWFGRDFLAYVKRAISNPSCRFSDDLVVSNWLAKQEVSRMVVWSDRVNRANGLFW